MEICIRDHGAALAALWFLFCLFSGILTLSSLRSEEAEEETSFGFSVFGRLFWQEKIKQMEEILMRLCIAAAPCRV